MSRPRTQAPELSAIVVACESGPDLAACLDSVRREARREGITAELLVVDNASRDGAPDQLDESAVIVLRNDVNRGFGAAVNQGFQRATGRRVLVLNPDARLEEGALGRLMAELDADPSVALAAPTLRLPDGALQESPRRFYDLPAVAAQRIDAFARTERGRRARDRHVMTDLPRTSPADVDWVTGAAMLLDREAIAATGPFDERFFLYFEDVDLCRRLGAMDRRVRFVPDAVVRHGHARGSRRQVPWNPLFWHHVRSGLLYASRWSAGWWQGRWWRAGLGRAVRAGGRGALLAVTALALGSSAAVEVAPAFAVLAAVLGVLTLPALRPPAVGRAPRPSLVRTALGLALAGFAAFGVAALVGLARPDLALPGVGAWVVACTLGLEVIGRLAAAVTAWLRGAGLFHRAVLVAGPPAEAEAVVRALAENPQAGLGVLGFVPLDALEDAGPTPRLRPFEHVVTTADDLRADAVLLTGPPEALARMAGGVAELRAAGVSTAFVLSGANELLQEEASTTLAGLPVMPLGAGPEARLLTAGKGLVDRVAAGVLLVALSPVLLALAGLSALAFRGAPLVRAGRIGLGGAGFAMWRLRSGPGAPGDEGGGRLGALLRALHLDELPQLVNVLRGEMSLVGPRPVTEDVYARLSRWERARCAVRPGITGMWQLDRLRRWRLEQMITSDLLYLLRWSPGLDLQILARTLLGRRG